MIKGYSIKVFYFSCGPALVLSSLINSYLIVEGCDQFNEIIFLWHKLYIYNVSYKLKIVKLFKIRRMSQVTSVFQIKVIFVIQ